MTTAPTPPRRISCTWCVGEPDPCLVCADPVAFYGDYDPTPARLAPPPLLITEETL